jgi:hypothetical protein
MISFFSRYFCKIGFSNYAGQKQNTETTKYTLYLRIQFLNIKPKIEAVRAERKRNTLGIENCEYMAYYFSSFIFSYT